MAQPTEDQIVLLEQAQQYCDDNDKSTEFMLQYMADTAGIDYDDVVEYLVSKTDDYV